MAGSSITSGDLGLGKAVVNRAVDLLNPFEPVERRPLKHGFVFEATPQERKRLQEELCPKPPLVAGLRARLDASSKKAIDCGDASRGAGQPASTAASGNRLVGQIHRLQEELYAKNKRRKGA